MQCPTPASKMHRFVLYLSTITVFFQLSCRAQIPCIKEETFLKPNRSIEFDLSSKRNQTGHWISNLSVRKSAPKLPNNLRVQVQQYITERGDLQSFHVNGIFIVPPTRPADYELFPGIGYYKFHTKNAANFDDAMNRCFNEGGHLAIINSEEESQVLMKLFARYPESGNIKSVWAYIGFHDRYNEGEYLTIFSQPLSSTGFWRWSHPNQPDNYQSAEDCGSIHRNGGLNDIGCGRGIPFFCEFDLSWENP